MNRLKSELIINYAEWHRCISYMAEKCRVSCFPLDFLAGRGRRGRRRRRRRQRSCCGRRRTRRAQINSSQSAFRGWGHIEIYRAFTFSLFLSIFLFFFDFSIAFHFASVSNDFFLTKKKL